MAALEVHLTTDVRAIEDLLRPEPVRHAYLLGYLDDAFREQCQWLGASDENGRLVSLILVYTGLARPGLFTAGDPRGIQAILEHAGEQLPVSTKGHVDSRHLHAFATGYRENGQVRLMSRMGLSLSDFRDREEDLADGLEVVRLSHRDTADILQLYGVWEDHFFEPYQLEDGLYFGIRDEEGRLACIAGTHNVSDTYGVASIGNLVTSPSARGRGLARRCTARLLRGAFRRVRLVTLDVQHGNEPAMRLYRHFGFRPYVDFREGRFLRMDK